MRGGGEALKAHKAIGVPLKNTQSPPGVNRFG